MNTRNLILAFVLTFLFLFVYELFVYKPPKAQPTAGTPSDTLAETTRTRAPAEVPSPATPAAPPTVQAPAPGAQEPEIFVETPLYRMTLSAYRGDLLRFVLIRYATRNEPVELVPEGERLGQLDPPEGRQILWLPQPAETLKLQEGAIDSVVFRGLLLPDSVEVRKVLVLEGGSYTLRGRLLLPEGPVFTLRFDAGLNPTEKDLKEDQRYFHFLVLREKLHKIPLKKLKEPRWFAGDGLHWAGVRTKYFSFFFIPQNPVKRVYGKATDGRVGFGVQMAGPVAFRTYFGPFDYFIMKSHEPELAVAYDFGNAIISPFSKAILYALKFLYRYIPNYGWVIVVFALLMKLLFWPLTYRGLRSMQRMQELKPKIDAIRKMYKDDPQRMQQEIMELYRKYKVNPFSGCLPLLLQLPIFWALYQILRMSIDFRGAPWILWIHDLSLKDPYYVLPILMGLTSMGQALLQPAQDRQSRMLALFMPAFITLIFLNFPAGIVLYWLWYNLFSLVESLLLRRARNKEE